MAAAASPSPKVGTRASVEGASATELTSVPDLQAEVRRLRLEVERLSAQLMGAELASPPALVRRGSTLPDGSRVEIEPDELASMRRMFDAFDFDSSTTINATELKVRRGRDTRESIERSIAPSTRRVCSWARALSPPGRHGPRVPPSPSHHPSLSPRTSLWFGCAGALREAR